MLINLNSLYNISKLTKIGLETYVEQFSTKFMEIASKDYGKYLKILFRIFAIFYLLVQTSC